MPELPEWVDGLPDLRGYDEQRERAVQASPGRTLYLHESGIDFGQARGACAVALHMHQPLIPAGGPDRGGDLRRAPMVGNLQFLLESPYAEDRHNAEVYRLCYKRMGDFIPQLAGEGHNPRITFDFTGTLLYGLQQMGAYDVLDNLKRLACDWRYPPLCGMAGHRVGPRGGALHPAARFSPARPSLAEPLCLAFWIGGAGPGARLGAIGASLAQSSGRGVRVCHDPPRQRLPVGGGAGTQRGKSEMGWGSPYLHLPNRLVCTNSQGQTASILAFIKTQGSDTKIVAQMQPYDEAGSQSRWEYQQRRILPLVFQIADGENGHAMMDEFPAKYFQVVRQASGSAVPLVNPTEYLEYLWADGWKEEDFPVIQPVRQKRIWERLTPGEGPEKLAQVIEQLHQEDYHFHVEGGSWTNDISWIYGYENVLGPMEKASALFQAKAVQAGVSPDEPRYRNAPFHVLSAQTSCFRYWGQGPWTDYGREISHRAIEILTHDF